MKVALLACALLAAAIFGSRLWAQDSSGGQCANGQCADGQCNCQQCGGGQCSTGCDCNQCSANCCAKCGCSQGNCNRCGHAGPFAGACAHCHKGICSICHHPPHHGNRAALYRSTLQPWHGGYYYTQWGAPVALVIPPTAEMHADYSWGVPSVRVSRNDHQFQRPFPVSAGGGAYGGRYGFLPTPQYPSDTSQFGVYYVRGPW